MAVNGRNVYVEETGRGAGWVVFEAGGGAGRTCWDPVVRLLADEARLVAYDRAGFGRSGRIAGSPSVEDMAADLVAMIDAVVPVDAPLVLVAHSMGGLVARRAVPLLGDRLGGLLLVDPAPEQAPVYDDWDRTAKRVDRSLAVAQVLVRSRAVARMTSGSMRAVYPADTYETMLAEDFTPSGLGQTRKEIRAVAAAVHGFRAQPPALPECPTVLVSADKPMRRGGNQDVLAEYQRRYVETLPDGRFEQVDSKHFVQAEQPEIVADRIRTLLDLATKRQPATEKR